MMRPVGRLIVGSECFTCRGVPCNLGFANFFNARIEAYCDTCFSCIGRENRIKILSVEYEESDEPLSYQIILGDFED
jgi:hypothetical protein